MKKFSKNDIYFFKDFGEEIELENGEKIIVLIYSEKRDDPFSKYENPTISEVNYRLNVSFKIEDFKRNNLNIGSNFIYDNETYQITAFLNDFDTIKSCEIVKIEV